LRACIRLARMSEAGPWCDYVKMYSQGDKQGRIAERIGVESSTVGRWLKGQTKRPDALQVIDFAREYGRSPIEALIHATFITVDEVGQAVEIAGSMRDVSDKALLDELADRLKHFRGILTRNDTQGWPPPGWRHEDAGVGHVQDSDNRG
jgi:transcriptional regulator with XRE-family HTH domain